MAGRSSQADNRGTNFFGFLASGKGKEFHSSRSAFRSIDANYFGDESDGAFNSSGATSLTVTNKNGSYDGDMMVRQYSSFTLNTGHNYTVDQPCRGPVSYTHLTLPTNREV